MRLHSSIPILTAVFLVLLAASGTLEAQTNRVNGLAANVNGSIITVREVYERMMLFQADINQARARYGANNMAFRQEVQRLENRMLAELIDEKLILTDYQNSEFKIPESYFDDLFQERIKSTYGDRVSFITTIKAQGQTVEEFKADFINNMIIAIMSNQKIRKQVAISPFKIERYYEAHKESYKEEDQVKMRLIVIPRQGSSDLASLEKAEMVLKKLQDGGDFAALAREYSTGPQARDGGDMGWTSSKDVRKEISEKIFDMKPGETSNLILAPDAVFIAKLEEFKPAHYRPLTEVRQEIEQTISAEQESARKRVWIDSLRKKSYVRTF